MVSIQNRDVQALEERSSELLLDNKSSRFGQLEKQAILDYAAVQKAHLRHNEFQVSEALSQNFQKSTKRIFANTQLQTLLGSKVLRVLKCITFESMPRSVESNLTR